MFYFPLGKEIEKRRIEQKLSRHALSKRAGLGSYALARLEKGMHRAHPLRAKALAEALDCDVENIFELSPSASK